MATEKEKQNGKSGGTALVKSPPPGLPAKQTPKMEEVQVNAREANTLSVEETIRRVAMLSEHIHTRRVLFNHLEKLESLKFGEFDEKDCLILQTAGGQSYTIKSPALCKKLTEVAKQEISSKIDEIEAQLIF